MLLSSRPAARLLGAGPTRFPGSRHAIIRFTSTDKPNNKQYGNPSTERGHGASTPKLESQRLRKRLPGQIWHEPKVGDLSNIRHDISRPDSAPGRPITVAREQDYLLFQHSDNSSPYWRQLRAPEVRDGCQCPKCVDPISGQKNFASTEVPPDIGFSDISVSDDGLLLKFDKEIERLVGTDGSHETLFSWASVDRALKATWPEFIVPNSIRKHAGIKYWDRETLGKSVRKIDYEEYMQGGASFWDAAIDLSQLGIVFLKNVPHDEDAVVKITQRLASIKETFYGRTFDVRAKPEAENVAYTSEYLGLHQDLLYLDSPPKIQILHCIENSCEGGESLFSDAERVGWLLTLFMNRPSLQPLRSMNLRYHYNKNNHAYKQQRPLLSVYGDGIERPNALSGVWWSPPFQAPSKGASMDMATWIPPARLFEELINHESAVYTQKMEPGECVLFDNRRVLHGRTAFDAAGGSRWLRGAYIDKEDYFSRMSYVPRDQAVAARGGAPRWQREIRQTLKASSWYQEVKVKIQEMESRYGLPGPSIEKGGMKKPSGIKESITAVPSES